MIGRRRLPGAVILLSAIAFAGCSFSKPPATGEASSPAAEATVLNTTWRLLQLGQAPVIVTGDAPWPTLTFRTDEKLAQGMGGCNRFSGAYELDGRRLRIGPLVTTKMACPRLETETAYLSALESARSWSLLDDRLELLDAEAKPLALFEAPPKTP